MSATLLEILGIDNNLLQQLNQDLGKLGREILERRWEDIKNKTEKEKIEELKYEIDYYNKTCSEIIQERILQLVSSVDIQEFSEPDQTTLKNHHKLSSSQLLGIIEKRQERKEILKQKRVKFMEKGIEYLMLEPTTTKQEREEQFKKLQEYHNMELKELHDSLTSDLFIKLMAYNIPEGFLIQIQKLNEIKNIIQDYLQTQTNTTTDLTYLEAVFTLQDKLKNMNDELIQPEEALEILSGLLKECINPEISGISLAKQLQDLLGEEPKSTNYFSLIFDKKADELSKGITHYGRAIIEIVQNTKNMQKSPRRLLNYVNLLKEDYNDSKKIQAPALNNFEENMRLLCKLGQIRFHEPDKIKEELTPLMSIVYNALEKKKLKGKLTDEQQKILETYDISGQIDDLQELVLDLKDEYINSTEIEQTYSTSKDIALRKKFKKI